MHRPGPVWPRRTLWSPPEVVGDHTVRLEAEPAGHSAVTSVAPAVPVGNLPP